LDGRTLTTANERLQTGHVGPLKPSVSCCVLIDIVLDVAKNYVTQVNKGDYPETSFPPKVAPVA